MSTVTILGVLVAVSTAVGAAFRFGDRLIGWIAEWRARRTGRIEKENEDLRRREKENTRASQIDGDVGRMTEAELDEKLKRWRRGL